MSTTQTIKQLEERNVASEISHMVWSDRMDLVAIANVKGEVTLYRLSWTKAWSLPPEKDGTTVTALAWRLDGKVIAIAYSNQTVLLVVVENKRILHTISLKKDITCLYWAQEKVVKEKNANSESGFKEHLYENLSIMVQEPRPQNSRTQKSNILQEQSEFNLLLVGTKCGLVYLEIFGCFFCAILNVASYFTNPVSIDSIHLNEDLSRIIILVRSQNEPNEDVEIIVFDSDILKQNTNQLFQVAHKQVKLTFLVNYLKNTIEGMKESYETILLEMDEKLSKYADKVDKGGVIADFLDLLMFGICSDEMKEFLLNDLTRKGLEKFGQNIELSYTNIDKLLVDHVMNCGQNITYHLVELRGMARLGLKFGVLGLEEAQIEEAIRENGAFLIKCTEMQQVMNNHSTNTQAFFRWLYTAIIHVMEIPVPNDIPKMTQQDLANIAEFLQNFDNIGVGASSMFVMERLGQYLEKSDLVIPINVEVSDWSCFLNENACLKAHTSILQQNSNKSLVQQFYCLKNGIDQVFQDIQESINCKFTKLKLLDGKIPTTINGVSWVNVGSTLALISLLDSKTKQFIHLVQVQLSDCCFKSARIYFSQSLHNTSVEGGEASVDAKYAIVSEKFYSNTILSVLLQESELKGAAVLYQMSLVPILEHFVGLDPSSSFGVDVFDGTKQGLKLFKIIDGLTAKDLAVSGDRRVGIVLSENCRKVRLYEMEAEEEDDEDVDMTSLSIKEDVSVSEADMSKE